MQAAPLATLNGSVMSAFKSPTLSPPSAELAQTLGKMASNSAVYEISATAPAPAPSMDSLADLDEDKCSLHDDEVVNYSGVSSYYPSLESQSSRVNSPSPGIPVSPKNSAGNLTPVSASSKDDSSSSSSSSEVLSALEDEVSESPMPLHLAATSTSVPNSAEVIVTEQNTTSGTHVKHWTYEDQFKQVNIII